jgi:hypothetical protein
LEENFSGKNLVVVSNREPYIDKKVEHQELVAYYRMADVGKGGLVDNGKVWEKKNADLRG